MTKVIARADLEEAAINAGIDVEQIRTGYSGRGMFGRKCIGLVWDSPDEYADFVYELQQITDIRLSGAAQDNMGRSMITYWPGYQADDTEERASNE